MVIFSLALCVPFLLSPLLIDGRPNTNALNRIPRPMVAGIRAPSEGPVVSRNGTALPPYDTVYWFNQLIDHDNPGLGTFKQRYWHTAEFYEPGGPIIIFNAGEGNADGYEGFLTNKSTNGLIAQQQNGSTIVIEHRFYGLSNPYPDLTVESLRVHTIQQAIDDMAYFAKNDVLPMAGGDRVGPANAPWVMIGTSYSGALTSWTMVDKPGVFWAGYASSAVVEAITDFWRYFEPPREYMPRNCSADVEAVIAHVDEVFTSGIQTDIDALKSSFGMGNLTHLDDVASSLRSNIWDWQGLDVTTGGGMFYRFCDALEVKDGQSAPASGWGLDHALPAWGSFWTNEYLDSICLGVDVVDCLGTYNETSSFYTDTTAGNDARSWSWIMCNEVGYLQDGPPVGVPAIVSRIVGLSYDERQCALLFPAAFKAPLKPRTTETNARYNGWDVQINRLFFTNGKRDPWRDATVSAEGLNKASTPSQPIAVSDGFHASDIAVANGMVDASVRAVQQQVLAAMATWLAEWKISRASAQE